MDYTKVLSKIIPEVQGEDYLRLRMGVVDVVNGDGTVDVAISGVIIEDVPVVSGAVVEDGAVVHVLAARGTLLVIGGVAAAAQSVGLGLWARGQATSNLGSIGTTLTQALVTNTVTFYPGRVYETRTHGGVAGGVGTYANLAAYRAGPATLLFEYYRYPIPASATVYNADGGGRKFTVGSNTSGAVALYAQASSGTISHIGTTATPRDIEVWDVGDTSKFSGLTTW